MNIPFLPSSSWLEYHGRPDKPGQNLTTHRALIAAANGQEYKCYVKASPLDYPMVFTEAVGWLIAEALDLPRPKFAAVVMLPIAKLRQVMPMDQHWLRVPEILAFCASTVEGKHITGRWGWLAPFRQVKAFMHADSTRIAAYDHWLENQDRNSGNLLRTSEGRYVPIDNEAILYSLIWKKIGINFEYQSLHYQAKTLLTHHGYTSFEAKMILASHSHEAALRRVWPALQQLVQTMVANPIDAQALSGNMKEFLGTRGHSDWLSTELGHIP